MNKRIKQLSEQAFDIVWDTEKDSIGPGTHFRPDGFEEKFAELIVQECIGVVEGGRFLHDQAPTALFAKECSGAIKRHFGVEE